MKIKTADDLLALPADQRVDMLAFLEPAQLSRVFEAADDLDLKMGVIDTPTHVATPRPSMSSAAASTINSGNPVARAGSRHRLLGVD